MKKFLKQTFLFLCVLSIASTGWCIAIVSGPHIGTDVGSEYNWVATTFTLPNANPTTETNWVNSVLSPGTATFKSKASNVTIYNTDAPSVYAFLLGATSVEYFIVKNAKSWALFQNVADMDWGVFSPNGLLNIPGDSTFSHVSRFDSDSVPVPEPATMLLLGTGLIGLAGIGRKRFWKK